jgi:Carboxypeptidase regulatory-like domain/TonB-dependent Receptor Plug Domain
MSFLMRPLQAAWIPSLFLLLATGAAAQQPVAIAGRLIDIGTGRPIEGAAVNLVDRESGSITDSLGAFRLVGVPPGAHVLRVSHLAYGVHTRDVNVLPGRDLRLELRLSPQALELEPIEVEAIRRPRPEGANVVTREQIERLAGRARHIGDIVRMQIPGAVVSEATGGYLCIEFRGGASSRTTGCNYPLVVVDGLPVAEAGRFLRDLPITDIERIEFVPASQGSARYGLGATYGVLVIETRRTGLRAEQPVHRSSRYPAYDWASEPGHHPVRRTFLGAGLGTIAGTALGLAFIGCFPGQPAAGGTCIREAGSGAGLAALGLPIAGSAIASRVWGATAASRGRLLPNLAMSLFPAALGYGMYVEGVKSDFNGERALGAGLVIVGTPLVATLADHLFRSRKHAPGDSLILR